MLLRRSVPRLKRFTPITTEEAVEQSRRDMERAMKLGLRGPDAERRAAESMEAMQNPKISELPLIVNLWANSRPASTDLMYAFAQRRNTFVRDEPFCFSFHEMFKEEPPYLEELREVQPLDPEEALAEAMYGPFPKGTKLVLNKHMAKHLSINLPSHSFLGQPHIFNVIVAQHPRDAALAWHLPQPTTSSDPDGFHYSPTLPQPVDFNDLSYTDQFCLVDDVKLTQNRPLIVLDYRTLIQHPEATLRTLCRHLEIEWDPAMLRWKPGGRAKVDGVWAGRYYGQVHSSDGFTPEYREAVLRFYDQPLPAELETVAEECLPLWEYLQPHLMKIDPALLEESKVS